MTEDQIKEGVWVKLKHFPKIPAMLIVKRLLNPGWWGARYQADGKIMVYGEYHLNEFELVDTASMASHGTPGFYISE